MGYTAPRTWVAGEFVDEAMLNEQIRDNLLAAFPLGVDAWTSFIPTLTQSATVTKTDTYAKYQRIGRLIHAQVNLSVTGSGTAANDVVVGLPVAAATTSLMIGTGLIYDSSANLVYPAIAEINAAALTIKMRSTVVGGTNPTFLGSTSFTAGLASGDLVRYEVTYEAAS